MPNNPTSIDLRDRQGTLFDRAYADAYSGIESAGAAAALASLYLHALDRDLTVHTYSDSWDIEDLDLDEAHAFLTTETDAKVREITWECDRPAVWALVWPDAVAVLTMRPIGRVKKKRGFGRQRLESHGVPGSRRMQAALKFFALVPKHERFEKVSAFFSNKEPLKTVLEVQRRVYVLEHGLGGMELSPVGRILEALQRENYEAGVLEGVDHVLADLAVKSPCGRLIILNGEPGTGKTYLVRGIIESAKTQQFVLIPSHMVQNLTTPGFVKLLMAQRVPTCLIVEDADALLMQRMGDNFSAINALLNLADGIFGAVVDVRLICTTNAKTLDFDRAILRPGRLCRHISVPALTSDHADVVYKRLTGKPRSPTGRGATLAEVYAAARQAGWSQPNSGIESYRDVDEEEDACVGYAEVSHRSRAWAG